MCQRQRKTSTTIGQKPAGEHFIAGDDYGVSDFLSSQPICMFAVAAAFDENVCIDELGGLFDAAYGEILSRPQRLDAEVCVFGDKALA